MSTQPCIACEQNPREKNRKQCAGCRYAAEVFNMWFDAYLGRRITPVPTPKADAKTRECRRCKQQLPLDNFNKSKQRADGLHSWCKACVSEDGKARYEANKKKRADGQ